MLPGESHGGHLGVILGCRDKSDSRALKQHGGQPRTILDVTTTAQPKRTEYTCSNKNVWGSAAPTHHKREAAPMPIARWRMNQCGPSTPCDIPQSQKGVKH